MMNKKSIFVEIAKNIIKYVHFRTLFCIRANRKIQILIFNLAYKADNQPNVFGGIFFV
ncbi:MAG: hypothetical protein OHK0057_07140 [Thermoflexibacter sp.]